MSALDDIKLPDRYDLLRHIASGGMASVWCAHDRALGCRVAIKLLSERFRDRDAGVLHFKREARAAARLSGHPHVVRILDFGETAARDGGPRGRAYIVMEYLAGGTVGDALRVGSVRREESLRWIREAAHALDYAHENGVLHRDIKPANLLLDRKRVLHVADFGVARVGGDDTVTATGRVLGTAAYLSPERALGGPASEASDRYSLAVTAFELLVGQRPFTAAHVAVQGRQHVEKDPPPASWCNHELPASVDPVLARGMAKCPADRWPTATELAHALEEALTEPTPGAEESIPIFVSAAVRRRRRAPALAALAAGAFCLGVTLGAGHGSSPHSRLLARIPHRTVPAARPARAAGNPSAPARAAPPTSSTTPTFSTTATTPSPPPTTSASAADLEARGHTLMEAGDYGAATGVLRQALAAASRQSPTYAYALYDLGRSLRLSGDPQAAVPVLWQRMQIPNQVPVVRNELQLALEELGARARNAGGARGQAGGASNGATPRGPTAPGAGGAGSEAGGPGD